MQVSQKQQWTQTQMQKGNPNANASIIKVQFSSTASKVYKKVIQTQAS